MGCFARGINLGDHKNIGLIERAAEIVPEILRPRVAMRLKEHEQALVAAAARGFERRANLRGMMAVIVDQRDAANSPLISNRRPTPGKFREARADQIRGNIEREPDGCRGGGVTHVVNSRRRGQMEDSEIVAVIFQPKFARKAFSFTSPITRSAWLEVP